MRKFQTLKLSQFHKAKTCLTENWWFSGIMSDFLGEFFSCFGGQKKFLNLKKKYLSVRTKKLHKMKLKTYNFLFLKLNRNFKHELSPPKPLLHSTQPLYSVKYHRIKIGYRFECLPSGRSSSSSSVSALPSAVAPSWSFSPV